MSRFDPVPDVPVTIGPCECPGAPHGDGDVVYLAPALSAPGGMAAYGAIVDASDDAVKLQELLWRVYRDHGITSWNLLDEDGEPVPMTTQNIAIALPYGKGGRLVADKADELYNEDVLTPFLEQLETLRKEAERQKRERLAKRSRRGTTTTSPEAISGAPTSRKKRPSRSSTPATAEASPPA